MSDNDHAPCRRGGSRREFLKASTAAAVAANVSLLGRAYAAGKDEIKVGLVGCGGRGSGALINAIDADPKVRAVALADCMDDATLAGRPKGLPVIRRALKDRGQEIDDDHVFIGFDAYQKILKLDLDYVILATPPYFRPEHIEAAVKAGKNVFSEKPVAVDPPGARKVIAAGELAKSKGLSIAAGTQRRHEKVYLETCARIRDGIIGDIVAARCYWNMGQLWYKLRQDPKVPGREAWSDMKWMIRDWVNWSWLSGDHIVEQHVHNLDVINWFTGAHPVRAVGMGGRARRVTGNQFDFFAVDYEFADGMHSASYCRQINGCDRNVAETVIGTKGSAVTKSGHSDVTDRAGNSLFSFHTSSRKRKKGDQKAQQQTNPYVQEHIDLIDSIRNGKGLNEAYNVATSTLTAIMGRTAAYTGKVVTWEEMMNADWRLGPEKVDWDVPLLPTDIPVPGRV